jgi:cell division GTPase FtsZ
MAKSKTEKYIVVKSGVCLDPKSTKSEKIGAVVNLTSDKAACLVGKVQKASEHAAEDKPKADAKLVKENDKLLASIEELTDANTKLGEENDKLLASIEELTDANTKLGEENKMLKEQIGKLTEQISKPAE